MHPLHSNNLSGRTYHNGRWVCIDFETTNLDYGTALNPDNRIVCVSWQTGRGQKWDEPVQNFYGDPLQCRKFWEALDKADFLIAQNGKFEAHWLWRMGWNPTQKLWFDTFLAEWVLTGNNPKHQKKDLDTLGRKYCKIKKDPRVAAMMEGGVCPSQMPARGVVKRCNRDVKTTRQVMRVQLEHTEARDQTPLVVTRCLLMPILSDMERTGMVLDPVRVEKTYAEYARDYAAAKREFDEFTGGVNPRSPDQMAHYLYDKPARGGKGTGGLGFNQLVDARGRQRLNKPSKQFPKGRPKTDQRTLAALDARNGHQKKFLRLRMEVGRLGAALTKNLEFFKGVCDERECHFFTELRQGVAGTHRLSGGGLPILFTQWPKPKSVQGQNMPRVFKKLFTARDTDYYYEEADGKQLEFRVAAFVAQDAQMIADIRDPLFDAHIQTLCVTLHGSLDREKYLDLLKRYRDGDQEVYKQRASNTLTKSHTFKPLYGGEKADDPRHEAYYKWFQERYCGFYDHGMLDVGTVEGTGMLVTHTKLRFFWETYTNYNGLTMDAIKHKPLKPSVFNYPVQYLATGEIVPIAVIHLYYRVRKEALRVLFNNTVHDSAGAEVHHEDHPRWVELCKQAFTTDVYSYLRRVYGIEFNVPLGVEIQWGDHWGEGESCAFDVEPGE